MACVAGIVLKHENAHIILTWIGLYIYDNSVFNFLMHFTYTYSTVSLNYGVHMMLPLAIHFIIITEKENLLIMKPCQVWRNNHSLHLYILHLTYINLIESEIHTHEDNLENSRVVYCGFYVLTTSKVTCGWVTTCDTAYSRRVCPSSTMTRYLTQSKLTHPTSTC